MKLPKMILFDAGKTLIDYVSKVQNSNMNYLSTIDATRLLMKYIISNPNQYSVEEIDRFNNDIFEKYAKCRKEGFEVNDQTILKLVFDLLDIKFSISMAEVERIIWENSANVVPVEGIKECLNVLKELKIRTAVISNLDFSGYLLEERLNQLFPEHSFEFVIASSDYGIRKPNRLLFEAGIIKSGLEAKDIWYVGDKLQVDALGSQATGMTPVLLKRDYQDTIYDNIMVINDYQQLIQILKNIDR